MYKHLYVVAQALPICSFETPKKNQLCSALKCGQCEEADPKAGKASMEVPFSCQWHSMDSQEGSRREGSPTRLVRDVCSSVSWPGSTCSEHRWGRVRSWWTWGQAMAGHFPHLVRGLDIKSIGWVIFIKVFLAKVSGTFSFVFPDSADIWNADRTHSLFLQPQRQDQHATSHCSQWVDSLFLLLI